MDFGNLFSRSWNIVWGNKWMIVLGFLAALGAGASGGNSGSNMNYTFDEATLNPEFADQAAEMIAAASAAVLLLLCLAIIVGLVLWILRLTAQAGLIEGAARLDAGEKMGFGDALRAGWGHIWNMIGLNIVLFGLLFVISLVVGLALDKPALSDELAELGANSELSAKLPDLFYCAIVEPAAKAGASQQDWSTPILGRQIA